MGGAPMWVDLAILFFVTEIIIIIILVAFMTLVQISSLSQSQLPPLPTYFLSSSLLLLLWLL